MFLWFLISMAFAEESISTRISSKERIQKVLFRKIQKHKSVDQKSKQRPASSVGRALDS